MSDFRDQLREIRSTTIRQERVPLTDEELGLNDGSERYLRARDEIARHIEGLMRDFITEEPNFSMSHGFFEEKYSLSLSCDELCKDDRGEVDKCYSRLNFLLSPCMADDSFEMTSKLTVLNRDLPKAMISGCLSDQADRTKFRGFAETETLRFAERYFAIRRPSTQETRAQPS